MIGINESRYILQKLPMPRLTWYYDAFVQHEFKQALLNWFDTAEDISRQVLVKTKNQIDYYFIHQEYNFVKKRLLSTYLENERLALNGHLKERALNILKVANTMENSNVKSAISKAAEESLNSVIEQVKNPSKNKEILKSSFESALIGLKTGYMDYQGDKVVPLYVKELSDRTSKLSNLSPEEEDKLFALNESQKKQLMSLDKAAKTAYLGKLPEISASLRNTDVYQNVAKRIKAKL